MDNRLSTVDLGKAQPHWSFDYYNKHYRHRTALFNALYDDSEQRRAVALDHIFNVIRTWISQLHHSTPNGDTTSTDQAHYTASSAERGADLTEHAQFGGLVVSPLESDSPPLTEETKPLLRHHLLVMLRMSINCPFHDVRLRFRQFLKELQMAKLSIPCPTHDSPSFFIPSDKVVQYNKIDNFTHRLMVQCFLANGRFSNVYRLMSYFPSYLETHVRTFNQILRLQGPLPRCWRNYIAIMAASQHQCQYLASLQIHEFLQNGGDSRWLQGLASTPLKLRKLAWLNTILAHQPWLLTEKHIEELLKGDDSWSKSELVQAILVLATVHSLASFVMGCGVVQEIDMPGGTREDALSHNAVVDAEFYAYEQDSELLQNTEQLIRRLKGKEIASDTRDQAEIFANCENHDTFAAGGCGSGGCTFHSGMNEDRKFVPMERPLYYVADDLQRFLSNEEIEHVDFDYKSDEYSIFRLQDYNWEEHGCAMISKFLPEIGEYLDEEFNAILNLTDYSLFNTRNEGNNEHVDTWPFRQAIWYYVLRIAGMSHDDYNYHEVNIYLNKRIKQYIKKVACYPERIVLSDFYRMGFTFRPDEKCQINLLASEARKCAELLYALHALMKSER